jgi:hypothetical protein
MELPEKAALFVRLVIYKENLIRLLYPASPDYNFDAAWQVSIGTF